MSRLTWKPLPRYTRVADCLMVPIMFVLRGFKSDSLQKTHAWHSVNIDPENIDTSLAIQTKGTDTTVYNGRYSFLFHAPILGGWKDFTVYEVEQGSIPFHIGWVVRDSRSDKVLEARVQRLPIQGRRVRMLDGPPSYNTYFFAVDGHGEQVPLKRVGQGRLGDGKYLRTPLY